MKLYDLRIKYNQYKNKKYRYVYYTLYYIYNRTSNDRK